MSLDQSSDNIFYEDVFEINKEIDSEYEEFSKVGICRICQNLCNPLSQTCESCTRQPLRTFNEYAYIREIRDVFIEELKKSFKEIRSNLQNRPKKYMLNGVIKKYNKNKYDLGIRNLKRAERYILAAYDEFAPKPDFIITKLKIRTKITKL
jgi:hypothetical protein